MREESDKEMRSSRPISLFTERPPEGQRPSAFLVSIVLHCLVVGVVVYGFLFAPRINMTAAADRYTLRDVELNRPDPERRQPSSNGGMYPSAHSVTPSTTSHGALMAPSSSLRQIERRVLADKTLLQPDTPINKLLLKTTSVPSLLLWSVQRPKVQLITPPAPQKPADRHGAPVSRTSQSGSEPGRSRYLAHRIHNAQANAIGKFYLSGCCARA